ncbi:RNA polymerase sigma-70 factor, ECF subfamily [Fodinibius roseus]|uniref:RNA polymerase sigma-70 factor, ECF subfamily n=1 Tax=Fodinibius roseus TaxID=1194090 RepID=A0A1M4W0B4_9BACT|nr:RNA polymerase sigma-70 factor [Fodinibius roseus]SHE74637.1 RNA polymerase sigma-70 factor, ECF subfamily [Fodinibius roseus]
MGSGDNGDKVLLQKLKRGDETSFRTIYLKYHKRLFRLAFKYLRSKSLAEDAVHEVFVSLWNDRKKLRVSGSLRGFLFTAIKNHVLNVIDKDKRRLKKHINHSYEKKASRLEAANVIELSEYRGLYQSAVEHLPEKRRQVFELRTEEGLTNREVAAYMEISVHTVKSQYYKASTFIKEYVRRNMNRETGS